MSDPGHDTPHVPGPSLWPIAFAIGVACLLLGLVISWIVAAVGAAIAVVSGFLWAREVTRDVRDEVPVIEPETRAVADAPSAESAVRAQDAPLPAYTRSRFLEASTIGVGAAIGAVVTLPVLGFTVLPSFTNIEEGEADVHRDGEQINTLGPGDVFGEMGVLEKGLRNATVVAKTPMRLVTLSDWDVRRMRKQLAPVLDRLQQKIEERRPE